MDPVNKILGNEGKYKCDGCGKQVDKLAVNTSQRKECWSCYDSISFGG